MNPHSTCSPSLCPLARSLLLALSALSTGTALAGDLDGQTAHVRAGDPVEAWTLKNGSKLVGQNAVMHQISAADTSGIDLLGGAVGVAAGSGVTAAVALTDAARLSTRATHFKGGGIALQGAASAHLAQASIVIDASHLTAATDRSIGVDLASGATGAGTDAPSAVIETMYILVEDVPGGTDASSGLGVRLMLGNMDILDGSSIEAANVGAMLWGADGTTTPIRLRIDDSEIRARRGAAIRVLPQFANTYDITVSNGSTLAGGDGNLLLVASQGAASSARTDVNFTIDDSRVAGNITLDPSTVTNGTLNVILRNRARLYGRFVNVTSADIDSGSTWSMTGDSNVGHFMLGGTGTVALGNGSTFNDLTVDTFDGAGGTLLFNTQLGDDSSATDRLIIKGDANGQANVRVLNAGGAGAKTDKGIELIRVGGASNAQFDLQGRAVGGQYEYFLFKDATDGGWYLRSEVPVGPDPCDTDPTLPQCQPVDPIDPVDPVDPIDPIDPGTPIPVLRPEAGAYLANQFAMDQMLRHGWRDRQGGNTSAVDGVRGWARVDATQSKLSAVEEQLDLRVDRSRLQLGADIGVFDNGQGRVGVMGALAKSDATSRSQLTGYSARGKVNGGALGVYGNWSNDALYVDANVQRGQFRNRVQGEGLGEERYDSDIWQSSLEAGYRIGIGQIGNTVLSLQPELQLVYTDASIDRHTEANGTVVRSLGDSGLSGRMGLRLQGEGRSAAGASVSPYVVANWYRDGASNGMAFDDEALKASVPRNRYELNAGARVDFRSGLRAWGGFGVMRGDQGYREATANLSLGYRW
ncbi:autotransporter family porin [Stenotrophomonas geniculata]|uniref:autotransporter family protein n=1 Tax=Stenotrophomonas geniculata TaxID=86188 RepID=UPI00374C2D11